MVKIRKAGSPQKAQVEVKEALSPEQGHKGAPHQKGAKGYGGLSPFEPEGQENGSQKPPADKGQEEGHEDQGPAVYQAQEAHQLHIPQSHPPPGPEAYGQYE